MAGLDAHLVAPGAAVCPDALDTVQIAQDPVDLLTLDRQPRPAVDPRPPAARPCDLDLPAGRLGGERPERGEVGITPVVDAEVPVGVGAMRAARPAAAEHHAHDAGDLGEALCHAGDGAGGVGFGGHVTAATRGCYAGSSSAGADAIRSNASSTPAVMGKT
jgi:hypothetical protein